MRKRREDVRGEMLASTEGGASPFFSPDGQWIAFLTVDGKVKKIPVAGGGVITLATDAHPDYKLGAWSDDGGIFYTSTGSQLTRLDAAVPQRPPVVVSQLDGGAALALSPLPGSRGVLIATCPGNRAIASSVQVLDSRADSLRLLVPGAAGAWYSPTGHLPFTSREGGLFAMVFDPSRLAVGTARKGAMIGT